VITVAASSLSTFLDVTGAAAKTNAGSRQRSTGLEMDPDTLAHAAKALAAIHAGAANVRDLEERTGIATSEMLTILGQLVGAELVEFDPADGSVRLTEATQRALSG
jgi:hypothetical protein